MKRALPAVALVLVVAGATMLAACWWFLVRPYGQLPRDAAAITADWAALAPDVPSRANPAEPEVFAVDEDPASATPEQVAAIQDALAKGARMPVGCTVLRDVVHEPLKPSPSQAFHAARVLLAHDDLQGASRIALDLREGDFLSLAVSAELGRQLSEAGHPTVRPTATEVRATLVREASCGDRLFDLLISGALTQDQAPPVSPFFDFGIARLRYRDRMLQLIEAVEQPDPVAALEALPPVGEHALITRMLAIHPGMVVEIWE